MDKTYKNDYTAAISFPLGGIGSGSIGLQGNGALADWEINNKPNRQSLCGFSGFAIKAETDDAFVDGRFLQGDIAKDFMGGMHSGNHSWGFGHGPNRSTLSGGKHFENVEFKGAFPFASINFEDALFPGKIMLEAFNPFIPGNADDSSLPAAIFNFSVKNTTEKNLFYTIALSVTNPLNSPGSHAFSKKKNSNQITMASSSSRRNSPNYGQITLATDNDNVAYQEYWYRGEWFDSLTMFDNEFFACGEMKNRRFDKPAKNYADTSTLAAKIALKPHEEKTVRFVISWYVPNYLKYWHSSSCIKKPKLKNYYAHLFESSSDICEYCFENWDRLFSETKIFKEALFSSTLPSCVMDAIQGNLATLKTTTCLRLEKGEFYGWEGVNQNSGSCEGTCQHVWNYAYALPFLFPALERSIRETELNYNMEKSGKLHFRTILPLGKSKQRFRACVDGQMGTVMKFYREWKICGDTKWLEKHWQSLKKCIEYAWSPKNDDKWDKDKTGVIFGKQHHTLDVELFGANSWLTGFYHGALLAGAEMAKAVGEIQKAEEYLALYEKGHAWLEKNTFNGNHYIQFIDLKNLDMLSPYEKGKMRRFYWSEESKEIKYQIGNGCEIDQVVADWHADLMGLPHIFNQAHRKKALQSIYQLNFKSMREIVNPCRIFACNGEKGVIICAWDKDAKKPDIPIPYAQECMTGFEYAVACNMLMCSMEDEALEIISSIRERYDGKKRNPWAEIECGASYARAMSSFSFLITYSGIKYDLTRNMIGFQPIRAGKYFWAVEGAWGTICQLDDSLVIKILYGQIKIKSLVTSFQDVKNINLNGLPVPFLQNNDSLTVDLQVKREDTITIRT